MPDTSDDDRAGSSTDKTVALTPAMPDRVVKLQETARVASVLEAIRRQISGADVVQKTLDDVSRSAREALEIKANLASGLAKPALEITERIREQQRAALGAAAALPAQRAAADIVRAGETAGFAGVDGLGGALAQTQVSAAEALAVNAGVTRELEQAKAALMRSVQLRPSVPVDAAASASKLVESAASQAAVGDVQRALRDMLEAVRPAGMLPNGMFRGLDRMQLASVQALNGGITRELDAAHQSLALATARSAGMRLAGVGPPPGQLGISGTRSLLAQAVDGLAGQQRFLFDTTALIDLAGRIDQAVDQAEDTAFALWVDVVETQQAALHGDEAAVRRLARRWWRSKVPKSWLKRNDGEPSAFATALVLLDLDQYSPDNAIDLLRAVPAQVSRTRRDECSFFDRDVSHRLVGSLEGQAEALGIGVDDVRVASQQYHQVEHEVLAGLASGDAVPDFTNPAVVKLISVMRPEDVPALLANLEHDNWQQTGVELDLPPGEAELVRDRVRYRMNQVKRFFGGVRPSGVVGGEDR